MIRSLDQKDKGKWKELYKVYTDFYKVPMNSWILDTQYLLQRTMLRPIEAKYIVFFDVLFIEPDFRRKKIAQNLLII